jgi:hypothetical protein
MEELHRIHKDVPFGYWVDWVVPAYRIVVRKLRERQQRRATAPAEIRLIGLR